MSSLFCIYGDMTVEFIVIRFYAFNCFIFSKTLYIFTVIKSEEHMLLQIPGEKVVELKIRQKIRTEHEISKLMLTVIYAVLAVSIICLFLSQKFISAIIAAVIIFLCAIVVYTDERIRIIPNELVMAIFIIDNLYILSKWDLHSFISSFEALLLVTAVFAVTMLVGRQIGLPADGIGAGDLKLMMVTAYFVSIENLSVYLAVFAVTLLLRVAAITLKHKIYVKLYFPMGVHIYMAAALVPVINMFMK